MNSKCELIETCGFFLNFTGNSEVIKQGWIKNFCENSARAATCKRKLIREQTGKPPADNMTPMGTLL